MNHFPAGGLGAGLGGNAGAEFEFSSDSTAGVVGDAF